jgi:hypothetical protein
MILNQVFIIKSIYLLLTPLIIVKTISLMEMNYHFNGMPGQGRKNYLFHLLKIICMFNFFVIRDFTYSRHFLKEWISKFIYSHIIIICGLGLVAKRFLFTAT